MKKGLSVAFASVGLLFGGFFAVSSATAVEWRPNSPSEIQVVDGQKEYTMKWGDTLWAIGQKVNIRHEKLAEINGINLQSGEQYKIPVGRVLSFGGNVVTVKDTDGSAYSQSVIGDRDKIDQGKDIGEATGNTVQYPYAIARGALSYPATFKFQGMNVPDSITLDFSQGNSGKVTFDINTANPQEYNATFKTIATKEIRVQYVNSTPENRLRTVKVNTEIVMQPSGNYTHPAVTDAMNKLYLFINSNGGLSMATPNYAGNYAEGEGDVMLEILPENQVNPQQNNYFSGYSDEQIEYARVTEALLQYYGITGQPIEVSAIKNAAGYQVLPFNGSQTLNEASVTLAFSMDGTMASTSIITYISNHDGTIRFYRNPNHYQDSRYDTDAAWVKAESDKLVNGMQTLTIPTAYDQEAAGIIGLIEIH